MTYKKIPTAGLYPEEKIINVLEQIDEKLNKIMKHFGIE